MIHAWLEVAALGVIVLSLGVLAIGATIGAAKHKAPAPADPLVPGTNPGAGDAALPSPQIPPKSPAPGHGGLAKRTDVLVCGRTIETNYDQGTRLLTKGCDCGMPDVDWETEIRRLLS
jgi:hypothetical protein